MLVLLPPASAMYQSAVGDNNATGIPIGDFRVSVSDPPACTVGFLPPSAWRSPADTTTIDTPDGLYCKLPQECKSDKPFEPLAARQHALGPYPLDPNLIAQGIPPDERVLPDENIFGPLTGTPPPAPQPPPAVAPSGYSADPGTGGASVAVARYDPTTGQFATPSGAVSTQTDLVAPGAPKTWQDLVWSGHR